VDPAPEPRTAPATTATILVVDDEPGVRSLLNILLSRAGFQVLLASGGRAAIDLYRTHATEIGLVLMDVRMPDLDGPGTLAHLREINPSVICCFMSGNTGQYSEADLRDRGGQGFVPKPFQPDNLLYVLTRLLPARNEV
jgi:CheY-like chemotaxis protein